MINVEEIKRKKKEEYIRSSSTSLKFSNTNRINDVHTFISEYRKVLEFFVDYLWSLGDKAKIPSLLPKEETDKVTTWLTARAVQAASKQSSGIIRGTRTKQKKRLKQIKIFNDQGMFKKARKLQKIYDNVKLTKPKISEICPELDSRFVKIELENDTSFDGWITLTNLGNKMKIMIPFKKTKHFNKMLLKGKLKKGIRISKKSITFNFALTIPILKTEGETTGLDKGVASVYFMSDDQESIDDIHGWNYDKITKKMEKQKKGSRAFEKSQQHRKNYILWCLNQIDFDGIKVLNIEKIMNMRKGKRISRYLSHFTYTIIDEKLRDLALEHGVHVKEKSPVYTSQRCGKCGWTCKDNRHGKSFICKKCGNTLDADKNASVNISLDLPEITKAEQLKHKNRKGFYWNVLRKEPIVSSVQRV
jgi:transposase